MANKSTKGNINEVMKQMPHSLEAEQAVLGAIINDNKIAIDVVANIRKEDFYTEVNQIIFEQIKEINKENLPVDIVTLSTRLNKKGLMQKVGGMTMLTQLLDAVPSTANYEYYVNILKNNALLRRVIRSSNEIIQSAYTQEDADNVLAVAESTIYKISEERDSTELKHISEITVDVLKILNERFQATSKDDLGGLRVGFSNLDKMTNGFMAGQLIILAARPGCGKTSFSMNMVANLAKSSPEKVIAVFNLEMGRNELGQRLISNLAQVNSELLTRGEQESMESIWEAASVINDSNVYIDDSAMITAEQIMSKCRRLKAQKGRLDFILVDYLQLMTSSTPELSKQQQVADMSRLMKIMAKEHEVPVLVLSQMSRKIDDRDDKTPMLSDLRESGAIEQDADIVMFLTDGNFEIYNGNETPIRLIMAKHRNGSVGELDFKWDKGTMTFIPAYDVVHISEEQKKQLEEKKELEKAKIKAEELSAKNEGEPEYEGGASNDEYEDVPFDDIMPEPEAPPVQDSFAPSDENDILNSLKEQ